MFQQEPVIHTVSRQRPTTAERKKGRTAIGRIPGGDHGTAADVWERREIAKEIVALGQKAIRPVRARHRGKRLRSRIVNGSPADARCADSERSGKEGYDRGESLG